MTLAWIERLMDHECFGWLAMGYGRLDEVYLDLQANHGVPARWVIYYFILFFLVLHPLGICRPVQKSKRKGKTRKNVVLRKYSVPSVCGAQSSRDGALSKRKTEGKKNGEKKGKENRYMVPYWATLSSASHAQSTRPAWPPGFPPRPHPLPFPQPPTVLESAKGASPGEGCS